MLVTRVADHACHLPRAVRADLGTTRPGIIVRWADRAADEPTQTGGLILPGTVPLTGRDPVTGDVALAGGHAATLPTTDPAR